MDPRPLRGRRSMGGQERRSGAKLLVGRSGAGVDGGLGEAPWSRWMVDTVEE